MCSPGAAQPLSGRIVCDACPLGSVTDAEGACVSPSCVCVCVNVCVLQAKHSAWNATEAHSLTLRVSLNAYPVPL